MSPGRPPEMGLVRACPSCRDASNLAPAPHPPIPGEVYWCPEAGHVWTEAAVTPDWERAGRLLAVVTAGAASTTLLLGITTAVTKDFTVGVAGTVTAAIAFVAGVLCALARRKAARQAGEQP